MKRNLLFLCMAMSSMVHAQFSGTYAPSNWTISHSNSANSTATQFGSVDISLAPASIVINGSDGGSGSISTIRYSIPITQAGTVSFNYSINNSDGPDWDYFFWGTDNTVIGSLGNSVSGMVNIPVSAGQTLVLGVSSVDDIGGNLRATISNFSAPGSTALPVSGKDLNVRHSGMANVLTWTTFIEENNKGFEIQRSFDARNFYTIGFVASKAAGGHSKVELDYTFVDQDASAPVNYYRYRQTDNNGLESYSNVVIIKGAASAVQPAWTVYPNPVTKSQSLSMNNRTEGILNLFDIKGRLVYTQPVSKLARISLPVHLTSGTYFLVLKTAAGNQSATLAIN